MRYLKLYNKYFLFVSTTKKNIVLKFGTRIKLNLGKTWFGKNFHL